MNTSIYYNKRDNFLVLFIPLIFILSGCSAFMHGYTQSDYLGFWWPVDQSQAEIEPSGMARIELEMDFDQTIKALVVVTGYPDYIFVGSEQQTKLAYLEDDKVFIFQRSFWSTNSKLLQVIPVDKASPDVTGRGPPVTPPKPGQQPDSRSSITRTESHHAAVTEDFGAYFALIIGNKNYKYLPDLETPAADAKAIGDILRERYGFKIDIREDLSRYDIISALSKYRHSLTTNDNLLIYFAGHGIIDIDTNIGYWLPVDSEKNNPANWISNSDIASALKAIKAKHILVVADSCYSGTLIRSNVRDFTTQRGFMEWIKRMAAKRSRTALTSGSLEPVDDGGGDGYSVFARAFLSVLEKNQNISDMGNLFKTISRKVVLNAEQTPGYADIRFAGHDGGDFIFLPR